MSDDVDVDLDALGVTYLEGGRPPPELLAHVAASIAAQPRLVVPRATTAQRERFFAEIAETIKRAGGTP